VGFTLPSAGLSPGTQYLGVIQSASELLRFQ
jgi:hypothetical protein